MTPHSNSLPIIINCDVSYHTNHINTPLSSLSSSSPSSRHRFPSPHHSRGYLPFPPRNYQPPGDHRAGNEALPCSPCHDPEIPRDRTRCPTLSRHNPSSAAVPCRADRRCCCRHHPSYCPPPALFLVDSCFVIVASLRTRRRSILQSGASLTPEGSWFDGVL